MKKILFAMALISALALASTASADSTPTASSAPRLLEHLTLGYVNVFYGPGITDPFNHMQPNIDTGEDDKPLMMKNYINLGYKFGTDQEVRASFYWRNYVAEKGWVLRDPYFRYFKRKLINQGGFNMGFDCILSPGITKFASRNVQLLNVIPEITPSYDFPNSKWSISAAAYADATLFRGYTSVDGNNNLEFYFGPQVNYQLTPTFQLFLLYEMDAVHPTTTVQTWDLSNNGTDLEPGFSWDITPRINFSPWINFNTGNHVNFKTTAYGFAFTAKAL